LDVLNNREIATSIWFVVFAVFVFSNSDVRGSFKDLLNAFSTRVILIPFTFLCLHTLFSVWLLSLAGLWETSQIKNTVFWFFSVGVVSFFRVPKISDEPEYFNRLLILSPPKAALIR
jgi:hypothetical protein